MSVVVLAALLALGLADAAFSGFRASLGRTGMVDHRHDATVACCEERSSA